MKLLFFELERIIQFLLRDPKSNISLHHRFRNRERNIIFKKVSHIRGGGGEAPYVDFKDCTHKMCMNYNRLRIQFCLLSVTLYRTPSKSLETVSNFK